MILDVNTGESVAGAVARAVGEFEDRPVSDLPVLYETIDADALESLFASVAAGQHRARTVLSFDFSESTVSVRRDESVTVAVESPERDEP